MTRIVPFTATMRLVNLLVFFAIFSVCELIQLQTKLGNVTGTDDFMNNKAFHSFFGIPYAKPPAGERRFKKPQLFGKFGSHNGTAFGNRCPSCVQCFIPDAAIPMSGNENCLILNIQTPPINKSDLKPVMVWIHGGAYVFGSANDYLGDVFVTEKDVVFVALNYRLGLLGFPPVEDGEIPNNLGLWDQHIALRWINDNIEDYGGDKSRVTIFGESAGGSSVMAQLLSPHNNNTIFQKVISESGSLRLLHINQVAALSQDSFTNKFNCSSSNCRDVINCMQNLSVNDIMTQGVGPNPIIAEVISNSTFFPKGLIDSISTALLDIQRKTKPTNLKHIEQYEYMAGWNDDDGLLLVGISPFANATDGSVTDDQIMQSAIAETLRTLFKKEKSLFDFASRLILTGYRQSIPASRMRDLRGRTPEELGLEVMKLFSGDAAFTLPTIQTLQLHQLFNPPTYAYEYSRIQHWGLSNWPTPDWLKVGADHADEIRIVFGGPMMDFSNVSHPGTFSNPNYTYIERTLSRVMLDYWTSFAMSGKPVTKVQERDRVWNEYSDDFNYAHIGDNKTTMKTRLRHDMINLLTAIDDAYIKLMNQPAASTTILQPTADKPNSVTQDQYQYSIKSPLSADQMFTVMIVVTVITGASFIITLIVCIKFKRDLSQLKKITKKETYTMK